MRDGQDYKVMNETFREQRLRREHLRMIIAALQPSTFFSVYLATDSGILKRRNFFDTFKGVTPKYALCLSSLKALSVTKVSS